MNPEPLASPLAALSLIVAPALLTNASSLLAMSTSNRLARAVDRARQLEHGSTGPEAGVQLLRELTITEERAVLLLRTLRSFYFALGGFAMATLLALIGAVAERTTGGTPVVLLELVALGAGTFAVGALVRGSVLLMRETGLAVEILQERAEEVRRRVRARQQGPMA